MQIKTENLIKSYKGRSVVNGVSIDIQQNEIVGLLGPNGAGKTTTFYMITGIVKPTSGEVFFDDSNVTNYPMYQRSKMGIGYLAQENSIFRKLSIKDNITLVMEMNGYNPSEIHNTIEYLAEEFHIKHILDSVGSVLSGGERRRVEIARAISTNPKFLFLDEPFAGIDPVTIEEIQKILFKLKDKGIGILITDHNVSATLKITDRNFILIDGKIITSGNTETIVNNPLVKKYYLGESFKH